VLNLVATYWRLGMADVRSRAQYRVSFVLDFLSAFGATFIDFLVILVLFSHLHQLAGWSLPEIALLYGASGISFAIADLMVGHLDVFGQRIRTGTFDVLLVRPRGSLFQVIASELALRRLARAAQAGAVLAVALSRLPIHWTPGRVGMLGLMVVSGTGIFVGVWVAGAAISFWTIEIPEVVNSFTYGGSLLTQYPIDIFGTWLRRLLAFVVPTAFVAYYPSLLILDKPDPVLGLPWLGLFAPVVAVLTLAAGRGLWAAGVRRYRSTGS
jgi:ABC-2 type transport system permease protein